MTARFGFSIEQTLGHLTHARNLRVNLANEADTEIAWGPVPSATTSWLDRTPPLNNWTLRVARDVRRALVAIERHGPIDALFFHTQVTAVLATNWLRRYPSVVSLDATPWQIDALGAAYQHRTSPIWLERLKWQLNRNCFLAAHHLVAWSHWTKRSLVQDYNIPAERVTVIPPGVNLDDWHRPQPRTNHDGPVKILFVGGDLERKGGTLLLEAFRELRPLGVELHLVTRSQVEAQPGVFVYATMQPNSLELRQLYHNCDIFCLPTLGDCLPMVLSEAGATGMPLVSTRVAAIPEVVRDGETGLLIAPGDGAALTTALRQLVLDAELRLRLGAQAQALVAEECDAHRNAHRLLDLLRRSANQWVPTEPLTPHNARLVDHARD